MEQLEILGYFPNKCEKIPLFIMPVEAGFDTAPAEDYVENNIDLNEFLIEHPASTFFVRISGDSFKESGIKNKDILIVDSSIEPRDGNIVIASISGEMAVKIYRDFNGEIFLQSNSMNFLPLKIEPYLEFKILGTVDKIIHTL